MSLAPIIVFNYNRPEHSKQVWDALSRNELAAQSELYLYCDGPKTKASSETREKISKVHTIAEEYAIDAPKEGKFKAVHVVRAEQNKGLANSIIGGVTDVINKHGKVIVLEDDLLTSPYFLKYMNEGLDFYEKRPAVMSISANRPPMSKMTIPADYEYDVFVSLRSFSTGWATWKDRWDKVDWTLSYLDDLLVHSEQMTAFNRGGDDMTEMLCMQRDAKIDSWAIRFSFAHFKEHSVAILPCVPYVDNIGFDGTGIHSGNNEHDYRNNVSLAPENPRMPDVIYEDARIINAFANCYSRAKRPSWQKAINYIYRKLGKNPPFTIKKKIYY